MIEKIRDRLCPAQHARAQFIKDISAARCFFCLCLRLSEIVSFWGIISAEAVFSTVSNLRKLTPLPRILLAWNTLSQTPLPPILLSAYQVSCQWSRQQG
ncbi:MAG: hypothetical protein KGO52_12885 [Nitrospirota bacterium]|nr:hypothetical protein [Nitrospirota bacterium]